jgi:hypothetical protein
MQQRVAEPVGAVAIGERARRHGEVRNGAGRRRAEDRLFSGAPGQQDHDAGVEVGARREHGRAPGGAGFSAAVASGDDRGRGAFQPRLQIGETMPRLMDRRHPPVRRRPVVARRDGAQQIVESGLAPLLTGGAARLTRPLRRLRRGRGRSGEADGRGELGVGDARKRAAEPPAQDARERFHAGAPRSMRRSRPGRVAAASTAARNSTRTEQRDDRRPEIAAAEKICILSSMS